MSAKVAPNEIKKKWFPLTLAKQRKSQKMVLTTLHPWGVSQQAPAPQTSALKLTMKSVLHKVWAFFKWLLQHWALQMGPFSTGHSPACLVGVSPVDF